MTSTNNRFVLMTVSLLLTCLLAASQVVAAGNERPNILWIVVEDASPHIGCYGESTIKTPTLDRLALQGLRFRNAFVTCPVCSPCRSALVTGMYQTTLGAHNHRSQGEKGKAKGGPEYLASYKLPVPTVPRLFKDAGYYTCNSATGLRDTKNGKTDYNFVWNSADYDSRDWAGREQGQPFFAQVQLHGGKARHQTRRHATDPTAVELPPYYPDHPVLRKDWAEYLNTWIQTDQEVAAILSRLEDEGIADSTAVFFLTDHGVSHVRGKQFLYEEGIRVPLIVRLPTGRQAGVVRDDLVNQLDLAATSLALAGIERPEHLQGRDVLAADYQVRDYIYSARDRCDETVDFSRCVRTERFKYIRNFMSHLPGAQHNRYKDSKEIVQTMRALHAAGKLAEVQARPFVHPRPTEELYDLQSDPHELINLAGSSKHAEVKRTLRQTLFTWMQTSGDLGIIPEPVLEELGREAGTKYQVLRTLEQKELIPEVLATLDASDAGDLSELVEKLQHNHPAVRYWAATGIGLQGDKSHCDDLRPLLQDDYAGVQVAAALARCRLRTASEDVTLLAHLIDSENYSVGLFAIRALELLGPDVASAEIAAIGRARRNPFEFTRRIAVRLSDAVQADDVR